MHEKGQIFTTDFIFASAIFLTILIAAMTFGNTISNQLDLKEKSMARDEAGFHAANSLLSSVGEPKNWQNQNIADINAIGLVNGQNIIDNSKLQKLIDLNSTNYQDVKDLLGLAKYELHISIQDLNGSIYREFGLAPGNENEVSAIRRIALWEKKEVIVKTQVWE